MAPSRFAVSQIANKQKRQDVYRARKKDARQDKLQRRLAQAKAEKGDPALKAKRKEMNVPKTLDNMREYHASMLTANPSAHAESSTAAHGRPEIDLETAQDLGNDPFASYFSPSNDPSVPPKVLITTSSKATRTSYDFCEELTSIFPGAEFVRRKKGRGFEMGRIAGWCAGRGYTALVVVNEDRKQPNAITLVHLPNGPTAYFKLSSVQSTKEISGHARPTPHFPELVLNNFVTRLGHAVGRMFQTLFPPLPEFEGRQVVTLHNQRDFLFFRRHRYMFKSTEKAALQEIGPRFTLKLRWLKRGIPNIQDLKADPPPLIFGSAEQIRKDEDGEGEQGQTEESGASAAQEPSVQDDFEWQWKPELETSRRTFFL